MAVSYITKISECFLMALNDWEKYFGMHEKCLKVTKDKHIKFYIRYQQKPTTQANKLFLLNEKNVLLTGYSIHHY